VKGAVAWSQALDSLAGSVLIELAIPGNTLNRGYYEIRITVSDANGRPVELARYAFRIVAR
jgi:hypothetical protein